MPRLRETTSPMTRLLLGYQVNGANLSKALRCAPKTARSKIQDTSKLTLGDLSIIRRKFGIPADDLRGVMLF